jgi:2-(1,2-epoxy-1,2-dihydrophenyl)acetyl-CoA isomerase
MTTTVRAFGPVRLERDGGVAVIRFDRPAAYNALDVPAAQGFKAACRALADAPPRAIVIGGSGKAFGVGGDLAAMRAGGPTEVSAQLIDGLHDGIRLLAEIDAPVIGSLQGAVAGGSMSLALSCDLAIAADSATFNLAYARIGASCDGSSSWHLPRLVGLRNAMWIALLSDSIDAAEALRLGLVNRVVPAAALHDETMALARRLADGPTLAYGRIKRLLRRSFETDLSTQLDAEAQAFRDGTLTQDFAEGLEAFFGKRAPRFEGR